MDPRDCTDGESSSSYLIPNFPVKEPVFYIPRVPNIIKVPQPTPPKRPPPAGYDMRTLRKQLEFLNKELDEQEQTQSLLYSQNEQLWAYAQELLASNKSNATAMKNQVKVLHNELKNAHKERILICQKLEMARNSKKLLLDLQQEFKDTEISAEESFQRRAEAEHALTIARKENEELEQQLHGKIEEMQFANVQLDELRMRKREFEALEEAEDFFFSNRKVLKSAYKRFKEGVMSRMRLNKIHNAVQHVYFNMLLRCCWVAWLEFLHRKFIMKKNSKNRNLERLFLCIAKWKLHTVLEKLFKKSRRRVLLKRTFREWANHTKNALFESWALEATEKLKCKQFLRKHFMRWKSTITFLGWNCIRVLQLEGMAKNFHCRTIFRAWFLVSMERKAQLIKLSKLVPIVTTTQRVLCYWRELCQQRWRHRGKLMKRFFRRMLEMIRAREESAIARRHAVALWTGLQKKIALRHWREFTRKQLHYCHFPPDRKVFTVSSPFDGDQNSRSLRFDSMNEPFSPSGWDRTSINLWGETLDLNYQSSKRFVNTDAVETNRLSLYMRYNRNISMQIFRRKKRTALLQLRYNIMIQRRQQLCVAAGMRHFITRVLEVNFNIWKAHIEADIFFRKKNAHRVLLMTLSAWKRFVKEEKIERAKLEAIESLASKAERKRQSAYLMRWHAAVRREKQVRRLTDFHREKSSRAITVRAFRCWLSRWASKVYWKYREALCECEKVLALREIDMEQRKAAEFEQKELASKCDRLVKSLHENELLLEEKRREKNDQDQRILDAEDKRQALLVQLETLAKELKDAQRERDQVRAFEHVIIEEVTSLENEMQRRQREAEDQMVAMQKESAALREEVEEARSQSYFSERFSTYETQRNENEYNMAVDKAALSQAELHLRREELAHLANEQSVIMQELARVQQKLVDANRDGSVLTSENESILRKKTSKLGVLRSETGILAARVQAMYQLLSAEELEEYRNHVELIQKEEKREFASLLQTRERLSIQQEVADSIRPYTQSSSSTQSFSVGRLGVPVHNSLYVPQPDSPPPRSSDKKLLAEGPNDYKKYIPHQHGIYESVNTIISGGNLTNSARNSDYFSLLGIKDSSVDTQSDVQESKKEANLSDNRMFSAPTGIVEKFRRRYLHDELHTSDEDSCTEQSYGVGETDAHDGSSYDGNLLSSTMRISNTSKVVPLAASSPSSQVGGSNYVVRSGQCLTFSDSDFASDEDDTLRRSCRADDGIVSVYSSANNSRKGATIYPETGKEKIPLSPYDNDRGYKPSEAPLSIAEIKLLLHRSKESDALKNPSANDSAAPFTDSKNIPKSLKHFTNQEKLQQENIGSINTNFHLSQSHDSNIDSNVSELFSGLQSKDNISLGNPSSLNMDDVDSYSATSRSNAGPHPQVLLHETRLGFHSDLSSINDSSSKNHTRLFKNATPQEPVYVPAPLILQDVETGSENDAAQVAPSYIISMDRNTISANRSEFIKERIQKQVHSGNAEPVFLTALTSSTSPDSSSSLSMDSMFQN